MQEVLAFVNWMRAEYDIGPPLERLPAGKPCAPRRCPIANSLGHGVLVDGDTAYLMAVDKDVDLPLYVRAFIVGFDEGDYPELIEG